MKNIHKLLISLTFFCIAFELISFVYLYSQDQAGHHFGYYQKENQNNYHWNQPRIGHPYFGFVFQHGEKVNNMGFYEYLDLPYKKRDPQEFVVGILGGSVALALSAHKKEFRHLLKENNPSLKNKKIIILILALGMGKQPQQFHIASFFMPQLDLVINLDGFNELEMTPDGSFPPEFPSDYEYYLINTPERVSGLLKLKLLDQFRLLLTNIPLNFSPLAYSQSYFFTTSRIIQTIRDLAEEEKFNYGHEIRMKSPLVNNKASERKQNIDQKMEIWKRYTLYQSKVASAQNIPSYFFLQPNQYVKNSKPLSDQERATFKWEKPHIDEWYIKMRKTIQELKEQGVEAFDLSDVFLNTKETIYTDDCCHINHAGNILLIEEMAKQINLDRKP